MPGLLQRAIGGFLEGAGQGAADANMLQMRADVELEKAKAIEDMKNAPLNRIAASAQQFAQEDVPVTPAPVTGLSAASAAKVGLDDGLQGNNDTMAGLIAQARANLASPTATAEQKENAQGILNQIGAQTKAQGEINADTVAGQTRKRTTDEAIAAAMDKAKLDDPVAYQAGRAMVQDNTVNVPEGAMVFDRTTGKVIAQNTGKADRQQAHDDARADIEAAKIDSREKIAQDRIEAAIKASGGANSQVFHVMQSYDNDVKSAQAEIRQNNVALAGMSSKDPKRQVLADNNLELMQTIKATQASKWAYAKSAGINIPDSLVPAAGAGGTPSAPLNSLPAGAKQVGTSGGKPVYEDASGKRFIQQ